MTKCKLLKKSDHRHVPYLSHGLGRLSVRSICTRTRVCLGMAWAWLAQLSEMQGHKGSKGKWSKGSEHVAVILLGMCRSDARLSSQVQMARAVTVMLGCIGMQSLTASSS